MDARRLSLSLLAFACCLAAAPAAQAAYGPKLAVTVTPTNTPGKPVGLKTVVTQASDEEPTKSARVKFPVGFGFDIEGLRRVPACTPAQRDARACPEPSRLGTATAVALGQTLTGGVHLGEGATVYIFLDNAVLRLLGQEPGPITARTEFRPDGGTDTVLDELPSDFTATRFELALDGPPRSVLSSPTKCGPVAFSGEFTSRGGVKATSSASVSISNCPPPALELSNVRMAPRAVRRGATTRLSYVVNRATALEVTIRRSGRPRILGRRRYSAPAGAGRVTVGTRGLPVGLYIVRLRATVGADTTTRPFALRIRR